RRPRARHGPGRAVRARGRVPRQADGHQSAGRRHPRPLRAAMRVILAEDSVLFREGVDRLLSEAGVAVVGHAGDADTLVSLVERERPDAAIVDIRLPPDQRDEGLRATALIRQRWPEVGVLLLSQYVETAYIADLIALGGGVGYLLKDRVANPRELVDAVQRVAAGGSVVDPEVVRQLVDRA